MFNFKKTGQLVEKELKPEEEIEHYIEGKSAIKTSAGTELVDTAMAVTNKGDACSAPHFLDTKKAFVKEL